MRMLRTILILSAIFILAITSPVYARGGGHGGGGRGGGHHGGHGGHYRGGWGYRAAPFRGYYYGWGYSSFYWPYLGWPYYYGSPYLGWPYSAYYPYSSYYSYPSATTPYSGPQQQEQQQPYYWYFCQDPQGYYPYVKSCPGGWMKVVPSKPNATPSPALGAPVPPVSPPGKDPAEAQVQPGGKPLTNDDIISFVRTGLSEAVILSVIQKSPTRFDLGPEALIKLKEAGISNTLIEAMRGGSPLPVESAQQPPPAQGLQPAPVQPPSTQGTVNTLLAAIATNNYDAFVANAAPALKTNITKEEFKRVSTQLSPRLKKGYELQYLGSLKQQGAEMFLWKIIYKDAGNDMLARLVLQDNKVAAFWFE